MGVYILRRLITFVPMLLFIAFAAFLLSYYGPGDPIRLIMGENWTSEEVYQSLHRQYGLDRPLLVQFGDYLWHAFQGDFGRPYIQRVGVGELIDNALPVSAQLALVTIAIIAVVGIGSGIIAALWHLRWPDTTIGLLGVLLHSVPSFVLAPVVLVVLVLRLDLFSSLTGWHGIVSLQTFVAAAVIAAGPLLCV